MFTRLAPRKKSVSTGSRGLWTTNSYKGKNYTGMCIFSNRLFKELFKAIWRKAPQRLQTAHNLYSMCMESRSFCCKHWMKLLWRYRASRIPWVSPRTEAKGKSSTAILTASLKPSTGLSFQTQEVLSPTFEHFPELQYKLPGGNVFLLPPSWYWPDDEL